MLQLHNQCFQRQSLDFLFSLNWSLSSHISERLDGMSRNLLCRYRTPKQRNLECFQRCLRWVRENPDRTQYLFPKCTLRKFQLISLITTNYNVECAVPALCMSQKSGFSACLVMQWWCLIKLLIFNALFLSPSFWLSASAWVTQPKGCEGQSLQLEVF